MNWTILFFQRYENPVNFPALFHKPIKFESSKEMLYPFRRY